jgi:hypothetical protein
VTHKMRQALVNRILAYQAPCPFCSGVSSQVGSVIQTFAPDDAVKGGIPGVRVFTSQVGKGSMLKERGKEKDGVVLDLINLFKTASFAASFSVSSRGFPPSSTTTSI